jgi:palmitoyltransferase ZDHHC9/14/18
MLTGPAQTFFCGGRLVAGPEWPSLFGTSALILAPCVVFLVQVVPELARAYSPALLAAALWLPLFSLAALFVTGCSDPGIIPRIPPPEAAEFPGGRPRTKEVVVRGVKVSLKWNESTNFYQPPRAHHCSVNNDCVAKFDHHCPWVGTTIGQRNYRPFLLFILNTSLLCLYVFALSALQVLSLIHISEPTRLM